MIHRPTSWSDLTWRAGQVDRKPIENHIAKKVLINSLGAFAYLCEPGGLCFSLTLNQNLPKFQFGKKPRPLCAQMCLLSLVSADC